MKKLYNIAGLTLIATLTLTGCGNSENTQKPDTTKTSQSETYIPIRNRQPTPRSETLRGRHHRRH